MTTSDQVQTPMDAAVASRPATGAPAVVVLGPKTRLGRALVARALAAGTPAYVVARDDADAAALAELGATVLRGPDTATLAAAGHARLAVHVCALGPVHPDQPETAAEAERVARDLALLEAVVDAAAGAPVHVVLVSTVIALAPGADRRYYGGWKALVEEDVRDRLASRPAVELSVLYPGRLVEQTERRRPWHRLHTSYARLAAHVEKASLGGSSSRVVGLDARAWLFTRGASLVLRPTPVVRDAQGRRAVGPGAPAEEKAGESR
ncbi:hypothetical protein [Nocardioides sp. SYSU D00038]|uniref:hypothetical protein n=1 Tax=Nocardioides sp. SYSU D00038 TaxID=2812554 RepID=UPI001967A115|nr:hypothetical protein [Nocardioides sp. SYSU D00038]